MFTAVIGTMFRVIMPPIGQKDFSSLFCLNRICNAELVLQEKTTGNNNVYI